MRTPEEFAAGAVPGFVHAPGGQLVQATDQWVGVKGARIVLVDAEEVRAPVMAAGCASSAMRPACCRAASPRPPAGPGRDALRSRAPSQRSADHAREVGDALRQDTAQVVDLRPGMSYRKGHIPQARWSIRPRIAAAVADAGKTVVLVADEPGVAALAAIDLAEAGCSDVRLLAGGHEAWRAAGLPVAATPDDPPTPTASTSCSSPTAATRAMRKPRASTSPGRSASSPSSTRRSAASSASATRIEAPAAAHPGFEPVMQSMRWTRLLSALTLACALIACAAGPADAQGSGKTYRIGFISLVTPSIAEPWLKALHEELRKLGYEEGRNLTFLPRYSQGDRDRMKDLAAELASAKVDVFLAAESPHCRPPSRTAPTSRSSPSAAIPWRS